MPREVDFQSGTGSCPCWDSTAEKETDELETAPGRGGKTV